MQDYYAFGMQMPGRKSSGGYRYGFNGKENDNEVKGEGNQQDYGMRIYDGRIGKFLSVDPLTKSFAWWTPYQFAGNMPIKAIDIDGMEPDKILNMAESLLYTPYEFGGKDPSPKIIGLLAKDDGKKFWKENLLPQLRIISNSHPAHNRNSTYAIYQANIQSANELFSSISKDGSLGIDCSGFVAMSYKEDKELPFNAKLLNTGSSGQLEVFQKEANRGNAIVHKDFSKISPADFIYKPGHVMIATGELKYDKEGKVEFFQTMEANSTDVGSIVKWRKVSDKYTIGHPIRTNNSWHPPLVPPKESNKKASFLIGEPNQLFKLKK